jgi:hypothetical protein
MKKLLIVNLLLAQLWGTSLFQSADRSPATAGTEGAYTVGGANPSDWQLDIQAMVGPRPYFCEWVAIECKFPIPSLPVEFTIETGSSASILSFGARPPAIVLSFEPTAPVLEEIPFGFLVLATLGTIVGLAVCVLLFSLAVPVEAKLRVHRLALVEQRGTMAIRLTEFWGDVKEIQERQNQSLLWLVRQCVSMCFSS